MPAPGSTAKEKVFLDLAARRSFQWKDSDKFMFLWAGKIALVHVEHDRGFFFLLSSHTEQEKEQIYQWLYDRKEFIWGQLDD